MAIRIDCVTKPDRFNSHERISWLGGLNSDGTRWKMTEDAVIKWIRAGHKFYTHVDGVTANVIVAEHLGRPYLKTDRDSTVKDNLLSLKSCPIR